MFHLPPGFEIQLVAAEPDINKPMNIAFDDRSRLWVTSSVEYPFPAKDGATPRDSIMILEDTDGDGRADVVKTFVDGLNIPIGVLPVMTRVNGPDGRPAPQSGSGAKLVSGCVAYSIPNIWRFLDTDGDDRADTREVLLSRFGFQDTHGMASSFTWGFDGWIYATHGFANTSEVRPSAGANDADGPAGMTVKMNSGNTFRFRPDGSRVEQWTWGQVNPFGLAFDSLGNLFSADCHSRPIMMLLRGAYYQSFGKPHDGLGFAPEICTHEHGSTGIAGIVHYDAAQFPAEYRSTIFTGNPVTNRINHDRLDQHGSTSVAVHQPDFLACDDPWFRPVALTLGPDGALYVADFYNKIIGHYEVPLTHPGRDRERGRIWRIVYNADKPHADAVAPRRNWNTATANELIGDLAHHNSAVRTKATNQLVERVGLPAAEPLRRLVRESTQPAQRRHAAWVLERLGELDDATLDHLTKDSDPGVRVHLQQILADRPRLADSDREFVWAGLRDASPFVERAAADALGRHVHEENLLRLLEFRKQPSPQDTQLLHAARMALRDQFRSEKAFATVALGRSDEQSSRNIADVMPGIASPAAGQFLLRHLAVFREDRDATARYLRHAARQITDDDERRRLLALARTRAAADAGDQLAFVRAIHDGLQRRAGPAAGELRDWASQLARAMIESNQPGSVGDAIELARTMKLDRLQEPLANLAITRQAAEGHRSAALGALASINAANHLGLIDRLLGDLTESLPLRQQAAGILGGMNRPESLAALAERLRTAPEPVAVHIAAALATSDRGAEQLLAEVSAGKASARLLQHPLVAGRLTTAKLADLKDRVEKLLAGQPPADERLQKLIDSRRAGFARAAMNSERGANLFEMHCAICHTLAGKGSKVGPQLDGIGVRGLDRILEDVLDPNRNVDQAFRSTLLALKNGQLVSGLVLRTDGDVLVVADDKGKELYVPKSDIEEQKPSHLSSMPANVIDILPEPDFYDLLAFLLSQRDKPAEQP